MPQAYCFPCSATSPRRASPATGSQLTALRERDAWYVLTVSAKSIRALKREEARQRMADVRRARKSRRAAIAFERRYALTYGAKGRITNLRQMMEAMAQ
jgi:hypothetical protein